MERIAIKPDKKLKTKLHLILLTISSLFIIIGFILQFTVTLGRVRVGEAAIIIWPILLAMIIILWLIAFPIIHLWVKNLEYFIEDERITIQKGIITKIQQNIPYRAITDFMLNRSLYDRVLNIGSIRIQTAGQSVTPTGFEANLSGLLNWEKLLEELRARLKRIHHDSSPLGMTEAWGDSSPEILKKILDELTLIREALSKK